MRIHPAIADNSKHLRHLAAMLRALADLAERAAGRSRVVCALVLCLLDPAEAVARQYLQKIAPGAVTPPARAPLRPVDAVAVARDLAARFRARADTLAALAHNCRRPAPPGNQPPARSSRPAARAAIAGLDSS